MWVHCGNPMIVDDDVWRIRVDCEILQDVETEYNGNRKLVSDERKGGQRNMTLVSFNSHCDWVF